MTRLALMCAAAACAAAAAIPHGSAKPTPLTALKAITGASDLPATCLPPGEQMGSPNLRDAETEPHVAVNPRDDRHVVAAWVQDHEELQVAVSRDGGDTWTKSAMGGLRCEGDVRVADPWLSFAGDGRVFLASLAVNGSTPSDPDAGNGVTVQSSRDGGLTWSEPDVVAAEDPNPNDFPRLAADPTTAGRAYVVWTHSGAIWASRRNPQTGAWSLRTPVYVSSAGGSPFASSLLVLGDGSLLCIIGDASLADLSNARSGLPHKVVAVRSTDGGGTWSAPVLVGEVSSYAVHDPSNDANLVRATEWIVASAAGGGDDAYVAWTDVTSETNGVVRFSRSNDGGRTWSEPAAIARVASQVFEPAIAVSRGGIVGVTYYDFRNDVHDDDELTTNVWFSHSHDGATWDERAVAGPFDTRTAPLSSRGLGYFIGDYQGLSAGSSRFVAVFQQARPAASVGRTDIFFARLALPRSH